MGYMKIPNLYADKTILQFRECYALEKVHGTSAHVAVRDGKLHFHAGGVSHEQFVKLFDVPYLNEKLSGEADLTFYGEAFGGKCQGMSATYGPELRFVVFDVKRGNHWLDVPDAADCASAHGLRFVWWERVSTAIETLNLMRARESAEAQFVGIYGKQQEGIVLRVVHEGFLHRGNRIIAKHKNDAFRETKTPRVVSVDNAEALRDANAIADEWVTEMRLTHVLDDLIAAGNDVSSMIETGVVIAAMLADVEKEAGAEVVWTKEATKAVRHAAAKLFRQRVGAL